MADPVLRLDTSKPSSECRGERAPDDPHYKVVFWQGQKVGKDTVLLPFDANGLLVDDDGKTEPYEGLVEGKKVTHFPLWTKAMRDLRDAKLKRITGSAGHAAGTAGDPAEAGGTDLGDDDQASKIDDVNFLMWLTGGAVYEWAALQAAARKRYSIVYPNKRQMVTDLVLDHNVVREDQLAPEFVKMLPAKEPAGT